MAVPYNSGAVLLWVSIAKASPVFLGTGRTGPDLGIEVGYEDLPNDLGGTRAPFDRIYQSGEVTTSVELTRWNEPVLSALETASGTPGAFPLDDLGSLMVTEGFTFVMWLLYTNGLGTHPVMTSAGMPAGYRFPFTILEGPRQRSTGTRANSVGCTFRHMRGFDPATETFSLYDFNMTAVSGLAIN